MQEGKSAFWEMWETTAKNHRQAEAMWAQRESKLYSWNTQKQHHF